LREIGAMGSCVSDAPRRSMREPRVKVCCGVVGAMP
jgi:hypothetical protein